MSQDKRHVSRIAPFVTPCRVISGARRFAAIIADLSPRGARITCDHDSLAVGESIGVEVRLARKVAHVSLPGTVVWVRPGERGAATFGVRFGGLEADDQRLLEDVLQDFERLAARLS